MHIHTFRRAAHLFRHYFCAHAQQLTTTVLGLLLGLLSFSGGEHNQAHFQRRILLSQSASSSTSSTSSASSTSSSSSLTLHQRTLQRLHQRLRTSSSQVSLQPERSLRAAAPVAEVFPAFGTAVFPVSRVPNWGAMRSAAEWDRSYTQMHANDFVPVPAYDLATLTLPLQGMLRAFREESIPLLTAKLFYSTRHFGAYDLDAGEFTGVHPGVDLKLAHGMPVGAIGGGRVHAVQTDAAMGLHVIVEHRLPGEGIFFSLYGHLDTVTVAVGDEVFPGMILGNVGMTGSTTAPHLHLQIDRGRGTEVYRRYWPHRLPDPAEAEAFTVHPILFIEQHSSTVLQVEM